MPQYNRELHNCPCFRKYILLHRLPTVFHLAAYLFDQHIAVQPVIFGIQGSFWCEAKQNPREKAVWRDFVWTADLHYKDVSRIEDVTLFFEAIHFVILGKIDG